MRTAIFNTSSRAYQVSNIVYAGAVEPLRDGLRKRGNTHSFKIISSLGSFFCYYKSEKSACAARSVLGSMVAGCKPASYKQNGQIIDPAEVISFSYVFPLKTVVNGLCYAFTVTVETRERENVTLWMKYTSRKEALRGRHSLCDAIRAADSLSGGE
jgi:hypothetical protein